ncbi:hypothetical protein LINPERHAP2_LOCUS3134, partial [Linum perenne]
DEPKTPLGSILDSGSCRALIDDPFLATGSWQREEEIAIRGSGCFESRCCQWKKEKLRFWCLRAWQFGFLEEF